MESTLGIGHAAKLLGITVKTLQRWEREGPRASSRITQPCTAANCWC
ncbi:MerR family DNA-binding transcriptional regulator [Massilia sp. UBA6681]